MRALKEAGLVTGGHFGCYELTEAGHRLRDVWFEQPTTGGGES
jgi:hypothetical protein